MSESLAVKYRPTTWSDVMGQGATKEILQYQLHTRTTKNVYLFAGASGCGKTTCARIFANEINNHKGTPIEIDAASNNSVDNVREISQQAYTKSLDSEYKIFILDEVHALSNASWQAMLKLIEEPPTKTVFIFCTTDPQKIPKTILSRVQRYDFKRIPYSKIVDRLIEILNRENITTYSDNAIAHIAKLAEGGMRDAITLLDKCLSYSTDLNIENVIKAVGIVDYETMYRILCDLLKKRTDDLLKTIGEIHYSGVDLKQFIKQFTDFILDINKWDCTISFEFIQIPRTNEWEMRLNQFTRNDFDFTLHLLSTLLKLNSDIKYETNPKALIEATLLMECVKS